MKHLKTFENYSNKKDKSEMINFLVENNGFRRSSLESLNEGLLDWFVKVVNNMDKGGRAKDFISEMPQKIKTLKRAKGGLKEDPTTEEMALVMQQAEKDGYLGKLSAKDGKLVYMGGDSPSRSKRTTSI
jgi:hypothetical protein